MRPVAWWCHKLGQKVESDALWSYIDIQHPRDCWEWTAGCSDTGYGQRRVDGRAQYAHRLVAAEWSGRELGRHDTVLHLCDNKPCCNPYHLKIGTQLENVRDYIQKGNAFGRPRFHLTDGQTADLVSRRDAGASFRELGARYGCSGMTANRRYREAAL